MSPRLFVSASLLIATLLPATGCKTPLAESLNFKKVAKLNERMPWHDEEAPREGIPNRVVGNWTDAIHYQEGKTPHRGFGGRLLFYDDEGQDPILVDGQLVIYAFNEKGRARTDNMPTRRYVFPAEELPKLMSKSELGTSYSVWLPWDEVGGPQAEVSLVCRFEPKAGPPLVSEQTRHYLQGEEMPAPIADGGQNPKVPEGVAFKPSVQQASYHATADGLNPAATTAANGTAAAPGAEKMTTTTIALPQSMQKLGPGMTVPPQKPPAMPSQTLPGGSPQANLRSTQGSTGIEYQTRAHAIAAGVDLSQGYRAGGTLARGLGASPNIQSVGKHVTEVQAMRDANLGAGQTSQNRSQQTLQAEQNQPSAAGPTATVTYN